MYRIGFAAYWLVFAAEAAIDGTYSDFVPPNPYPWKGVAGVMALLAVLVSLLYVVLRPPAFRTHWWRLGLAVALSVGMLAATLGTFVTDQPRYTYVPGQFAIVTLLLLLLVSAAVFIQRVAAKPTVRSEEPPRSSGDKA
jgi:hypothetical protein